MSPSIGVTEEDLVNGALTLLGEDEIDSLTDDDDISMICARVWEAVRDEVLGLYPWRFLLKKEQLGQLVEAPVNEWTYKYTLPPARTGEIRTVFNSDAIGAKPFKEYEIIGNELYTDATEIWVEYPWLPDIGYWPQHVRNLCRFVLAARLAEPITEDSEKGNKWEVRAYGLPGEDGMGGYFARARLVDSQQRPSQELTQDYSLLEVRG